MVGYPFVWTPAVIVLGAVVLLTNAYLALIALVFLAPVVLATLVAAIVVAPYLLVRSVGHRWQERSDDTHATPALSLAQRKERESADMRTATLVTEATPSLAVSEPASASRQALFVTPSGREGGFRASTRGHVLELADPGSPGLAPTPEDLLVASIASDLAWFARRFLRDRGLPCGLCVTATWRTAEHARPADIGVTVTAPEASATMRDALETALSERLEARRFRDLPRVEVAV